MSSRAKEKYSVRVKREREEKKALRRLERSQYSGHDGRHHQRSRSPQVYGRHHQRSRSPQVYGRHQRSRSPQTPTATVKVKGLPKDTTEVTQQFIQHVLAQWRPFLRIRVMRKTNTNICRGMAFIEFPSVVAAKQMMDKVEDHGLDVNGRKLSFEYRLCENNPVAWRAEEEAELKVSNESYLAEKNGGLPSPAMDVKALEDAFNSLEGVTCDKAEDGMYLFPHIQFTQRAIMAAEAAKTAPDAYYTNRLLEATGIIAVPGSDYGQVPGTWYIGLSILLQEEKLPAIITRLTDFHQTFMAEFHD